MNKRVVVVAIIILMGALTAAPTQAQTLCRVADPTPTPLNVRTSPDGRVVGALENGMLVSVLERKTDRRGQAWVYVGNAEDRMPIGWVFRDYVDCRPDRGTALQTVRRVADPTPTPFHVRSSPSGRVVGTLENGMLVSILDRTTDRRGQAWVYVGNAEDRMPIGWAFRDYIDCRSYSAPGGSVYPDGREGAARHGPQNPTPTSISVECAVVLVVPEDRDPNPGYKVTVFAEFEHGVLKTMNVIHTRVNGQQADRSTQYSDARLVQRGNIATWIGFRNGLKMTGILDPNKMTYNEYITRDGRPETQIDTRCHPFEGE
jgi:hypothetical protein